MTPEPKANPLCTCGDPLSKHNRRQSVDMLTGELVQHCQGFQWTEDNKLVKCPCRLFTKRNPQ